MAHINGFEGLSDYKPGYSYNDLPAAQAPANIYGYEDVWGNDKYGPLLVNGATALRAFQAAVINSDPAASTDRNAAHHVNNYESGD